MKYAILFLILLAGFSAAVNAQSSESGKKKQTAKTEQAPLKEDVYKDSGLTIDKIFPSHGEKGHMCTATCARPKSARGQIEFKGNACSSCINSNSAFARNERGHVTQINAKRSNSAH